VTDAGLRAVMLGPPGSGKGTQAELVAARIGIPTISTGELLRQAVAAGNELGRRVEQVMASGQLVDDALMAEVVRDRLSQPDVAEGFLLDGYPRTPSQAETLAAMLAESRQRLDAVVLLDVPEEELVQRALARKRADDREEVVRERLRVYREKTAPLISHYEALGLLRSVDGDRAVEEVTATVLAALGRG